MSSFITPCIEQNITKQIVLVFYGDGLYNFNIVIRETLGMLITSVYEFRQSIV